MSYGARLVRGDALIASVVVDEVEQFVNDECLEEADEAVASAFGREERI